MPKSFLANEGLTLEVLFAPIRLTLQPILTGPLLFTIYRYPTVVATLLPANVLKLLLSTSVLPGLSILVGIGLLRKINYSLSRLTLNNFTFDKSWGWTKEIVVITEGSSGIGAVVVRMLAEKNIRVIILDISPPQSACAGSNHS